MELEELMTNRTLLEKMSENNDMQSAFHKQPKHVIIQEHHSKPKEVRLEYKNNTQNNAPIYVENPMQPATTPVVLEGYGCKCPKKLKRLIKILWIMLLLLYIFGMPVVLVHLYSKLTDTKIKIGKLHDELDTHFRHSKHETRGKDSRHSTSSRTSITVPGEELENKYKGLSRFQEQTNRLMRQMERNIREHEGRYVLDYIVSI